MLNSPNIGKKSCYCSARMSNWPVSVQGGNGGKSTSSRNGAETCVSFACKAVSAEREREKEETRAHLLAFVSHNPRLQWGVIWRREGSPAERTTEKPNTSLIPFVLFGNTHWFNSLFPCSFLQVKKGHYSVLSTKTNRLLNKCSHKNTKQSSTEVKINSLCK